MLIPTEYIRIFTAILVIVNPIGAVPLFVTMASFRVGGGILVMLIAIAMFHAQLSGSKATLFRLT